MSNLSFYLICLPYFAFEYFIINFTFYSAQHSRGMFFVFHLLYTHGSLFLKHCIALIFLSRNMFSLFMASLTLLLRHTMRNPSQTLSLVWNGVWAFSLLIPTLPGMCLSTDGGLDMAF